MAVPTLPSAGAIVTTSTTSADVPFPSGIASGDFLILLWQRSSSISGSPNTPAGWAAGTTQNHNSGSTLGYFTKTADGSESGDLTVTLPASAADAWAFRIVRFASTGAGVWTIANSTSAFGVDDSIEFGSLTTTAPDRLGVTLIGLVANQTIAEATGETGGDWVEPVAEEGAAAHTLAVQTCDIPSATTVSGGAATIGSAEQWARITFDLARVNTVLYRASAVAGGNPTTSLTITIPASVQTGDILVAAFTNRNATANPSVSDNDTGGNTWAAVRANTTGASLYWKRATSGTASKTITASGFTGSCSGGVAVYQNCDPGSSPVEFHAEESNASGNETHAGFTPADGGREIGLVVYNRANDNAVSTQSSTSPGNLSERFEKLSTGGSDCGVALASAPQEVAAATGNLTWAQTNAATISISFSIKVAPPPAAAPPGARRGAWMPHRHLLTRLAA